MRGQNQAQDHTGAGAGAFCKYRALLSERIKHPQGCWGCLVSGGNLESFPMCITISVCTHVHTAVNTSTTGGWAQGAL